MSRDRVPEPEESRIFDALDEVQAAITAGGSNALDSFGWALVESRLRGFVELCELARVKTSKPNQTKKRGAYT